MKIKIIALAIGLTISANAAVGITGSFADLRTAAGTVVPNNTMFVLIGVTGSTFVGGFTVNTTLDTAGANSVFTANQTISLNQTIGGGTVFAIGGTAGSVAEVALSGLTNAGNTASGNGYAVYWFPGSTYTELATSGTIGSQVGGYSSSTGSATFELGGMIIPPNGQDVTQGFSTVSNGGETPNSAGIAVQLTVVPEPSAALLGAIGALGLLRRRRN